MTSLRQRHSLVMPRRRELATPEWALELHVPALITPNPDNDTIRDCVEALEEEDQNVILAYYYERRTLEWIAAAYGLKGRTSGHYRVQKALNNLRLLLAERGIDEDSIADSTGT